MYKITVIIPIYNTEKYIKNCLDSLVQVQIFTDCEIILIDDGSSDRSAEIAQEFVNKYKNIIIYHYKNSGLSAARNRGLEHATGKYIFFLDSDDLLTPDYLYNLYQQAEQANCEIVFAGFSRVTEKGTDISQVTRPVLAHRQVMTGCKYLHLRMNLGDWHNEVWCALYLKEFLDKNGQKFDEKIRLYEDILFTNTILLCAERVCSIPLYGYLYRSHPESLVQGGVKERDIMAGIQVLKQFSAIWIRLEREKQQVLGRVVFEHISMILYYIGQIGSRQKESYYQALQTPEVFRILRAGICTPKEAVKYLIFRWTMKAYYILVRKKEVREAAPLISVIVPIYNAGSSMEPCLRSIAGQSYSNIEVLLIDDGSTDNSPAVCRRFVQSDPRFRLFRQDNQGVSAARNAGLNQVHGSYLLFIDSDDTIRTDYIITLWQALQRDHTDMVVCDYRQDCTLTDEKDMEHYTARPGRYSRRSYIRQLSKCPGAHYFGVLWNKIYRTDLIQKEGLHFNPQLSIGEDFTFNMAYLSLIKRIRIIPDKLYKYAWRSPLSLTHCRKDIPGQLMERILLYQAYADLFRREHLERRWRWRLHYYLFKTYFEELKELGRDQERCRQIFYETYIRDQGISEKEFQLFYLLRKLKNMVSR